MGHERGREEDLEGDAEEDVEEDAEEDSEEDRELPSEELPSEDIRQVPRKVEREDWEKEDKIKGEGGAHPSLRDSQHRREATRGNIRIRGSIEVFFSFID